MIDILKNCGSDIELNYPEINFGGCCVYAAAVAAKLQSKGITVWGIVLDKKVKDLNKIKSENSPSTVKQWIANGVEFFHIVIQFEYDGKIWTHDSTKTCLDEKEFIKGTEYKVHIGYLDVSELVNLASCKGWNKCFDRKYIPKIVRRIWRNLKI